MRYESRNKKLNRQPGTVKNWIYRRGDIYLANLNPFKGSEQGLCWSYPTILATFTVR